MKKFSKILVLLLAMIAILTAFTVTILADETPEQNKDMGTIDVSFVWEDKAPGAQIQTLGDTKPAYMCVGLGQNGSEKYLISTPSPSRGGTGVYRNDYNFSNGGETTKKYNHQDYPYIVTDFDICSPTGDASIGASDSMSLLDIRYRIPDYSQEESLIFTKGGEFINLVNYEEIKSCLDIDGKAYNWQHVTAIAKFVPTVDDGNLITDAYYEIAFYVDGEYKTTVTRIPDKWQLALLKGKEPNKAGFREVTFLSQVNRGTSAIPDFNFDTFKQDDKSTWPGYTTDITDVIAADSKYTKADDGSAYISPEFWFKESIAVDNMSINFYQDGWTNDDIAAALYNAETYDYPFGLVTAKLNDDVYDNLSEAVDAAKDGDIIYLFNDITEIVNIDKKIIIDTRKYVDGEATSDCYTANFASDYEQENDNGVITFKEAENYVDVYWDPCDTCTCDSYVEHGAECDCTCFEDDANHPGHILGLAGGTAVLGSTLVYPGEIPTFDIVDGKSIRFVGWSRDGYDGEILETITVTEDDIYAEELLLYPVYEIAVYSFEVITSAGVTYHTADEFEALLEGATSGTTVKLLRDLEGNFGKIDLTTNKTLTLDLNGYDIKRANVYGTKYDNSTGAVIETVASTGSTFFTLSNSVNFTVTDSTNSGNSEIYMLTMQRDTRVNENGNVVDYTNGARSATTFASIESSMTFKLSNVSLYCSSFARSGYGYQVHVVDIDNCKLYSTEVSTSAAYPFQFTNASSGSRLKVTDTFIYYNLDNYLLRIQGTGIPTTFENCDIYVKKNGYFQNEADASKLNIIGCRFYGICNTSDSHNNGIFSSVIENGVNNSMFTPTNFDNGRYAQKNYDKIDANLPAGYIIREVQNQVIYTVIKTVTSPVDETGYPTFDYGTQDETVTYKYEVVKTAVVNWYDDIKNIHKTETAIVGESVTAPKLTYAIDGDAFASYRKGLYLWGDEAGTAEASLVIDGSKAEYNFYAHKSIGGKTEDVSAITGAQLSLVYFNQFHIVFYLPVVEGMDRPVVAGCSDANGTVNIDGKEYWTYTWWTETTTVFENQACKVTYTIDGKEYVKDVTILSGLRYAQLVLGDENYTAEHKSVANMVRYVRETLEAVDDKTYDTDIEALIGTDNGDGSTSGGLYDLDEYSTEYNNTSSDVDNYDEFIEFIYFGVPNGGSVANIYVSLTETAYNNGARITKIVAGGSDVGLGGSDRQQCAKDMKVYYAIGTIEVTVSVPEAAATEDVEAGSFTFTYSLGAYITRLSEGEPNEEYNESLQLAKAIYDFGVSAGEYKAQIEASRK